MNKNLITIALLLIILVVGGIFLFGGERQAAQETPGQPSEQPSSPAGESGESDLDRLSAAALTDYSGAPVSLQDFRGTPLILNAWATWCPFCKQELPDFAALQEEFPGIKVVAIDRQESLRQAKGYTDDIGITERMTFLLDGGDDFYRSIGGFSMPETVFINKEGRIAFHKRGPMTLAEMRAFTVQYLQ